MRKRSILLALGTALALVVLTAGLAFASGRWDGHHGSGYTTGHQLSNTSIQPTAQQPSGSVRPNAPQPARSCDPNAVHQRTHTQTATYSDNCTDRTTHQTSVRTSGVQQTRPVSTTGAGTSTTSQPRQGSNQWGDRHSSRDSHCTDGWR